MFKYKNYYTYINIKQCVQAHPEYVVPDRGTTKVYVEVSVAIPHAHQTVFLYFRSGVGAVLGKLVRP